MNLEVTSIPLPLFSRVALMSLLVKVYVYVRVYVHWTREMCQTILSRQSPGGENRGEV